MSMGYIAVVYGNVMCEFVAFRYEDGQVGDSDIDTQSAKYKKEIMKAVGYQTK